MSIKKKILSVVMPCLLLLLGAAEGLAGDAMNPASEHILRLHILAAGNTPEQQAVKYRLRDLLLSELAQAPEPMTMRSARYVPRGYVTPA